MAHPVPSGNRSFSKKASSSCKQIPAWQTQNNGEPKFKSASTTEREEDPIYTEATKCVSTMIFSPEGQKTLAEPDQCPKSTASTCLRAGRNQPWRREPGKTMPNEMKQPKLKQFKERRHMALLSHTQRVRLKNSPLKQARKAGTLLNPSEELPHKSTGGAKSPNLIPNGRHLPKESPQEHPAHNIEARLPSPQPTLRDRLPKGSPERPPTGVLGWYQKEARERTEHKSTPAQESTR